MPHELRPERLLAAILETSEDAVLSVGLDGAILSWSRGAQRLYGYAPSEIVGQSSQRLMPIYEITGFEEMLERAQRGEGLGVEVVERLHRDGTRLRMTVRRTAIAGEGGEIASVLEAGRLLEWSGSDVPADVQLRMVAEQMPGLVWTADRNLKITSNWGAGLPGSKVRPGTLAGKRSGAAAEREHRSGCVSRRRQDGAGSAAGRGPAVVPAEEGAANREKPGCTLGGEFADI